METSPELTIYTATKESLNTCKKQNKTKQKPDKTLSILSDDCRLKLYFNNRNNRKSTNSQKQNICLCSYHWVKEKMKKLKRSLKASISEIHPLETGLFTFSFELNSLKATILDMHLKSPFQ